MEIDKPHIVHFKIHNAEYPGLLTLAGANSKLEIHSAELLTLSDRQMRNIRGVFSDAARVTALDCVGASISGKSWSHGEERYSLSLLPNYVVTGPRYLDADKEEINALSFGLSSANQIFYDTGTFGSLHKQKALPLSFKREILKRVKRAPKHRRRTGSIDFYYHWDRGPIIKVACGAYTVSAVNSVSGVFPSPSGIRLDNKVRIHAEFADAVNFQSALNSLYELKSFFELIAESRQNIEDIWLVHKEADREFPLSLYLSNEPTETIKNPHPADVLIPGGSHPVELEAVLREWLKSHGAYRNARRRFLEGFRQGREYETDRLVGAANAFDLLPDSCFKNVTELSPAAALFIEDLKKQIKQKSQVDSSVGAIKERLLDFLGRTSGKNLRAKILSRYANLPQSLQKRLPGMEEVIGHCVQARNYFVHGTPPKLSTENIYEFAPFLTDTLEFIFAVSDLQSCGWNIGRWEKEAFTHGRLKSYLHGYSHYVKELKSAH